VSNVSNGFQTLVMNATLEGVNQSAMENNTYPLWASRMVAQASAIGVTLAMSPGPFAIEQLSPWTVTGRTNLTIYIADALLNASWNVTRQVNGTIELEAFEDPVYRLGTSGRVTNLVRQTPITDFVSGTNVNNLMAHANESYYRAWTGAPSFLQRLEGKLTNSSPYGIESLVNLQELSDAGLFTSTKSVVDYIYFSSNNPSSCTVNGTPSWFRMDGSWNAELTQRHPHFYEVEGLINGCLS